MKLFILIERFRARLRRLLGRKRKNTRLLIVVIDADEPMKGHMPLVTLKKPIKPGKRRLITLKPDEPVDIRPDGTFVGVGNDDKSAVYCRRNQRTETHQHCFDAHEI